MESSPKVENLYSELETLYQHLEKELTVLNPGCDGCGNCCNFSAFDHVLYASSIEVGLIARNVEIPDFNVTENICPFLKDNQCSIRDFRTLGCRIFYCSPAYKQILCEMYEKYYHMIKVLSLKHNVPWRYLPFLNHLVRFKQQHHEGVIT